MIHRVSTVDTGRFLHEWEDQKKLFGRRKPTRDPEFEAEHPRGEGGQFIDKTIIRKVKPLGSTNAFRRAKMIPEFATYTDSHGDAFMYELAHDFGFSGQPTVVSDEEIDQAVSEGAIEMWRGTHKDYVQAFRKGPYYAGFGFRGNGTYAAHGERGEVKAGAYAKAPPSRGVASRQGERVVMRMALKKQARVANWEQVKEDAKAETTRLKQILDDPATPEATRKIAAIEYAVAQDPGRYAMMLGYDAIWINDSEIDILNRTAVLVSDKDRSVRPD